MRVHWALCTQSGRLDEVVHQALGREGPAYMGEGDRDPTCAGGEGTDSLLCWKGPFLSNQ